MDSLSDVQKKRILNLLNKMSKDIQILKKKESGRGKKGNLKNLDEYKDLVSHYRKFVSPRKVTGKLVDKVKNKFYYETEYFIGEIIERQEQFNREVIAYLKKLEKEIDKLKKKK